MYIYKITFLFLIVNFGLVHAQNEAKHDIFVTSAAVQHLYRNCANLVNIDVPDFCNDYSPICTATNADVQPSSDFKRKFMIVPKGDTCTLNVYNIQGKDTVLLGKIPFNVIEPPKPTIEVLLNGQKFTEYTAVGRNGVFLIKVIPNPEFAMTMPEDSRYCADNITFYLHYSPRAISKIEASNLDINKGISIPVPSTAFQCQEGSRLDIQIGDIYRINFKGERILETMTIFEKNVRLITR